MGNASLIESYNKPKNVGFIVYTKINDINVVKSSPLALIKIKFGTKVI